MLSVSCEWLCFSQTCKLWWHAQFLLEGQEEVGSPDFGAFLTSHKSLLEADYALSADGGQMFQDQGVLAIGLRGAVAVEVTLQTLSSDQHSGIKDTLTGVHPYVHHSHTPVLDQGLARNVCLQMELGCTDSLQSGARTLQINVFYKHAAVRDIAVIMTQCCDPYSLLSKSSFPTRDSMVRLLFQLKPAL